MGLSWPLPTSLCPLPFALPFLALLLCLCPRPRPLTPHNPLQLLSLLFLVHSSLLLLLIKFSVFFSSLFPLAFLARRKQGWLNLCGWLESGEMIGEWGTGTIPSWGNHPSTFLMPSIHILNGTLSRLIAMDLLSPISAHPDYSSPFSSFSDFICLFCSSLVPKNASCSMRLDQPGPAFCLPHPTLRSLE